MDAKEWTGRRNITCPVGVCVPTEGILEAKDRPRRPCFICWVVEVTEVEFKGWTKILPDHLFEVLCDAYHQFIWELDNPDRDPRTDYRGGTAHWLCLKRPLYRDGEEERIRKALATQSVV
jgi:hypothetical protein